MRESSGQNVWPGLASEPNTRVLEATLAYLNPNPTGPDENRARYRLLRCGFPGPLGRLDCLNLSL